MFACSGSRIGAECTHIIGIVCKKNSQPESPTSSPTVMSQTTQHCPLAAVTPHGHDHMSLCCMEDSGEAASLKPSGPSSRRFSSSQISPDQDLLQRGGDPVVPPPRRAAGLHRVLHAHRHVVRPPTQQQQQQQMSSSCHCVELLTCFDS